MQSVAQPRHLHAQRCPRPYEGAVSRRWRFNLAIALQMLLVGPPATLAGLDFGDASCPCLTASELGTTVPGVPADFGIGCAPHFVRAEVQKSGNNATPEVKMCRNPENRKWCKNSWCFVDKLKCRLPTAFMQGPGLAFSFPTCGYLDALAPELASDAWNGSDVYVVYLSNSYGNSGSYCPATGGKCRGATFDYWTKILKGLNANVVPVAQFSSLLWPNSSMPFPAAMMRQFRQDYPNSTSTFEACVYATGMGFVDVCIGSYAIDDTQLRVSSMVPYYQQQLYLVAKQDIEAPTLDSFVASAWTPFDGSLWLAIGILVGVGSLLMVMHERYDSGEAVVLRGGWKPVAHQVHRLVGGVAFSIYDGWLAFWSGGRGTYEPQTLNGRLVSMGLALFVLMAISAYTANLASVLVQQAQTSTGVSSLADVVSKNYNMCVESTLATIVNTKLSFPLARIVPVDSRAMLLPSVHMGKCKVAAMYMEDLMEAQSKGSYCQYMQVEVLLTVSQGVPVSDRIFRVLDYNEQKFNRGGVWDNLLNDASYSSACEVSTTSDASNQLTFQDLLGPTIVACGFFAASLLVLLIKMLGHSIHRCLHVPELPVEHAATAGGGGGLGHKGVKHAVPKKVVAPGGAAPDSGDVAPENGHGEHQLPEAQVLLLREVELIRRRLDTIVSKVDPSAQVEI